VKYLVIGGTGTLGKALIGELVKDGHAEVRCLSRCELKQKELRDAFPTAKLRCLVGDIADYDSLSDAMRGINVAFHVAALKHVDTAEYNPEAAVKTNVLGTINVAKAAEAAGVPYCAFSSTDKAVEPINVYGMTKGISERILFRRNEAQDETRYSVFRWGNVATSRGAAIHYFAKTLREEGRAYITSPDMTRFWIRIDDAVKFMLANYRNAPANAPVIPQLKSASVMEMIAAVARAVGVTDYSVKEVGLRPGEKLHESLAPSFDSYSAERYTPEELDAILRGAF
jgi:FlaA1/EpsC-like NDP-sugar epimerase